MRSLHSRVRPALLAHLPLVLALAGCAAVTRARVETHLPAEPNPTSFVFDHPLAETRSAIRAAHGGYALARGEAGDGMAFRSAATALDAPGNEHDFFLWYPRHPYGWSDVYRLDGKSLPCEADYHLHLTALSPTRTKVEVIVIRPRVHAWEWQLEGTHWGEDVRFDVEPTTVEEYRILLAIGEALGTEAMPAIHLPPAAESDDDET